MAISFVQGNTSLATNAGGLTSHSVAFTSNNTLKNLIVAQVIVQGTTTTVTVSDSRSNSYSTVSAVSWATGGVAILSFYVPNIAAGANTVTATVTSGSPTSIRIVICEYSGAATSAVLDTSSGLSFNSSSSPVAIGPITTATKNELVHSVFYSNGTATGVTSGTNTGVTEGAITFSGYKVSAAAGSVSLNFTQTSATGYVYRMIAFKPADVEATASPASSSTVSATARVKKRSTVPSASDSTLSVTARKTIRSSASEASASSTAASGRALRRSPSQVAAASTVGANAKTRIRASVSIGAYSAVSEIPRLLKRASATSFSSTLLAAVAQTAFGRTNAISSLSSSSVCTANSRRRKGPSSGMQVTCTWENISATITIDTG
jgi:hypothetical protein